jgi:hypothetical protein
MRISGLVLRAALLAAALMIPSAVPAAAETVGYSVWVPGHTATVQGRAFGRLDRASSASAWRHQVWCVDKGVGETSVDWRLHRSGLAPSTVGSLTCDNRVETDSSSAFGPFVKLTVTVCKEPRFSERYCVTREYAVPNP